MESSLTLIYIFVESVSVKKKLDPIVILKKALWNGAKQKS